MNKVDVDLKVQVRSEVLSLDPYVFGKSLDETAREMGLPRLLRFGHNQNPIGPSPKAVQAIRNALKRLHIYPDVHTYSLKKALAKHLKVAEEQLIIGTGSNEIIRMVMDVFVKLGDGVLMGVPEYPPYRAEARRMGGQVVEVPLDASFRYDLPAMKQAVTSRIKMVVLTNPKYPTGTIIKKGEFESFIDSIPPHVVVVVDECYRDFVEDKSYPDALDFLGRDYPLIAIRTLSKAYGIAGVRVGYGVTTREFAELLHRVRPMYNVNALAEVAAVAALSDKEHRKKTQKLVWKEKRFLAKEFKKLNITYVPTEANFMLINVEGDDRIVSRSLLGYGLMTVPGIWSGIPGWIPVTINKREDNRALIRALGKVLHNSRR